MEYVVRGSIPLARGALLRIEDGRDLLLYVWSGGVWLTEEGERRDRFVPAGGWARVSASGQTLVSALQRSMVSLTSTCAEDFARRIDVVRGGGVVETILAAPAGLAGLRARLLRHWIRWFVPHSQPTSAAL